MAKALWKRADKRKNINKTVTAAYVKHINIGSANMLQLQSLNCSNLNRIDSSSLQLILM